MTINELFEQESAYWTLANRKFLGVSPIDENDNFADIQNALDKDCATYWNVSKPCKLAQNLNIGLLNANADKQTPNSYKLTLNFNSMCIDVSGDYSGKMLKICSIPTPSKDLCWIINKSHYVARVTAIKDFYSCVSKFDFETIRGEGWNYNIREDKFECTVNKDEYKFKPTLEEIYENHVSYRSRYLLEAVLNEPLTIDNFIKGLKLLPKFSSDSIFNYKFSRLEYFEDAVLNSKKFAQPLKGILLGVNNIIGSKSKHYSANGEKLEGCLVRSESKIFALENFRTCVNIYNNTNSNNSSFQPAFTYMDTNGFFDSFKTVTSKAAGRQRLLLDNIVVKDGLLWIVKEDGTMHNMFEYMDMPQNKRLSCLSESPFCNNDKPKRIMMNAKMTSQAVPLDDEIDDITHRITARVGFTDIEGYTSADSIIISESLAKRLKTHDSTILYLNKKSKIFNILKPFYDSNTNVTIDALTSVFPSKNYAILLGYTNVKIDKIDNVDVNNARVFISWEIPFRLGDKITNLHGAKGTVGVIMPDDKMPRLTRKVGNMEPGPLEIIISGFSTIRRGSLGQIFEAWAQASGIDYTGEDYISVMIDKYKDQMKTYSENSIVEYDGKTKIIPVGINYIMRLYHHASTKVSCSSADHGYTRTLRFGEMEKLNLVANDCPNILKELGIRSITKYVGSHKLVTTIEETRKLPANPRMSMQFLEILKSMGYVLVLEDDDIINDIDLTDTEETSDFDEFDMTNFNNIIKKGFDSIEDNGQDSEDSGES